MTVEGAVLIEMYGHHLRGPGTGTRVLVAPNSVVRVKNGRIQGWGTGIGTSAARLDQVRLRLYAVTLLGNGIGLDLVAGGNNIEATNNLIDRSNFVANAQGIHSFSPAWVCVTPLGVLQERYRNLSRGARFRRVRESGCGHLDFSW